MPTPTLDLDVESIRRDFPVLSRTVNDRPLVYLDSAATSQKPQAMIDALADLYAHHYAKVEEGHALSQEATKRFENVRATCARLINAPEPREIVFTRGCTEGINLIARAFEDGGLREGDEIVLSQAEHFSNIVPWQMAAPTLAPKSASRRSFPRATSTWSRFKACFPNARGW